MVLEYLPTKLGLHMGVNVLKYSSTMVRIWDITVKYTAILDHGLAGYGPNKYIHVQ